MKKSTILFIILSIPIYMSAQSISRHVISTNGSSSDNMEWTLGELMVQTYQSNNASINQGFHQGKLIITDVTTAYIDIGVKLFPNPTASHIIVETDQSQELVGKLYNQQGQFILRRELSEPSTEIAVNHLITGTYLLQIFKNTQLIKTFKIQKIN